MTPSPSTGNQLGPLTDQIHVIRGERVMLDVDLARLYGVTTARLNQQVKRNPARFPLAFMFQLTSAEFVNVNLLQNVTGSLKHRDPKLRPYAFTEHVPLSRPTRTLPDESMNSPRRSISRWVVTAAGLQSIKRRFFRCLGTSGA